jgi:hypothetical protein
MTVYIVYCPPGSRVPELHTNTVTPYGMHHVRLRTPALAWGLRQILPIAQAHPTPEAAIGAWKKDIQTELAIVQARLSVLLTLADSTPVLHAPD